MSEWVVDPVLLPVQSIKAGDEGSRGRNVESRIVGIVAVVMMMLMMSGDDGGGGGG